VSAGHTASYHVQCRSLRLKPWQPAVCWIDPDETDAIIAKGDDGTSGSYAAAKLVRRMIAAGVSLSIPTRCAPSSRRRVGDLLK
jgi:hypothetical protein